MIFVDILSNVVIGIWWNISIKLIFLSLVGYKEWIKIVFLLDGQDK